MTTASGDFGVPEEHLLTRLLREDEITLAVARSVYEEAGGGERGAVAARRYLDAELGAMTRWPPTYMYSQAADDFGTAGHSPAEELLRAAAAAGKVLEKAETAWDRRYAARAPLAVEDMAAALRRNEDLVAWDPGGPYLGIDGARYEPGGMILADADEPLVIAVGRGTREVITGWASFDEMQQWIAGRGTGGSRSLTPPPVPSGTRTWMEDTVLAYMVNHPHEAGEALRILEPDAMTTDVRYDVYTAIRHLSGHGTGQYTPEMIRSEAKAGLSYVPDEGLDRYGGAGGPFIRAYVSRLAETDIFVSDFRDAARSLHEEDSHARRRAAVRPSPPARHAQRAREQRMPSAPPTPGTCPEFPPGHVPGPQTGPVQSR